ncbi:TonB-dependent receptor [Litoribacillus peritrichatus]|uniref:Heme uptake receptor HasR n=1 Tax=Litoribacillus peritrichatus TaxID=718191 RepID=A0ABP7NBX7_9GAMM
MFRVLKPLVMLGLALSWVGMAFGEDTGQRGVPRYQFDIPAGELAPALNRFALTAKLVMYFDPAIAQGKTTIGLKGEYKVSEGFAVLLSGSGLIAQRKGVDHYAIESLLSGVAQNDGSIVTLDLLKVYGKAEQDEVYATPASVSTVSREQMARMPARNTSDVLASTSGVYTSQSRQDPGVSINIRGLQDFGRVNTMIDGTRQNFQKSGHGSNGSVYMDPELLAGVDVSKGPSSGVGGAAVIGGVVNFRTLEFDDLMAEGASQGGRLKLTTGSNAYHFSGNLAAAAKLSDNVEIVAAIGRKHIGAFEKGDKGGNAERENTELDSYWTGRSQFTGQDQWSGLLKGSWSFADDHKIKFSYIGFKSEFEEGSRTAVADNQEQTGGENATSENTVTTDTFLTNYQWQPLNDLIDLKASVYYTRTQNDQFRPESQNPADPYGEFTILYETNTLGGSLQNHSIVDLPEQQAVINFTYGTEFFYDWTRPESEKETAGNGREEWFSGPTPEGDRWLTSVFAQVEFSHASGLDLIAGLRYDYFTLEGEGEMKVGSVPNPPGVTPRETELRSAFSVSRHKGYFSPTLTAAYQLNDSLQVFSSYGLGVRPPSITETLMWGEHVGGSFPFFPNPGLEAERSFNFEVGANIRSKQVFTAGDRFNVKAAWFDNRIEHFITQASIMGPGAVEKNSVSNAFVNLDDDVRFYGVEIQAEYDSDVFFGEFSWTRTHSDLGQGGYDPFPLGSLVGFPATNHGDANGGGVLYVLPPIKKAALSGGVYFMDKALTFGLRVRMEDNDGRGGGSYQDAVDWQIYDAWANYKAASWLTFNLAVDNFTDRNYAELNGLSYWIAPGRTATGTATLTF